MQQAGVEQALRQQTAAACGVIVGCNVLAAGLEIAEQRRVAELMRSKSSMESGMPISLAMARKCSTALVDPPEAATEAMAFSMAARVMILLGRRSFLASSRTSASGFARGVELFGQEGGHAGEADRRDAEEFAGHGHGVGGELAAAGSGAGTGCSFDGFETGVIDLAGGVRADGLEDVLNGDVVAVQVAGRDGAAVEHEPGNVEARQRHDGAGHVLIAAGDGNQAVEEIAARDELHRVGDDLAADQRGLHAFGAHGDAVGDGDGVELHRRAAGFAHALLHGFGELAEVEVAGADFGPGIGDADDRLVQVFFREADAAQVGARCGAAGSFGERDAVLLRIVWADRSCRYCSCVRSLRGCRCEDVV